jgi:hypothetical protein
VLRPGEWLLVRAVGVHRPEVVLLEGPDEGDLLYRWPVVRGRRFAPAGVTV